ncbi:hypothetical protein GF345_00100, partial [Candidatus Woesearchaeota archaeon]|nr:hypothetical protein [Candidatus Woesearchaeota archaeon]
MTGDYSRWNMIILVLTLLIAFTACELGRGPDNSGVSDEAAIAELDESLPDPQDVEETGDIMSRAAEQRSMADCESIADPVLKSECIDLVQTRLASDANDISQCEQIENEDNRNRCFDVV